MLTCAKKASDNKFLPIPFLTARWVNLALFTYRLDPKHLEPYLPPKCELDLIDGKAFASLIAFDFADTRVLGVRWPGFVRFPEINLRFYVKYKDINGNYYRGVCFVKEIVPQKLVAFLAKQIYNEPYVAAPIKYEIKNDSETINIRYELLLKNSNGTSKNNIEITADSNTICAGPESIECFFKEQEWGFGTSKNGKLIRYKVVHPTWNIHPVKSFKLNWDWETVYGKKWKIMKEMEPMSVIFAEGSKVKVFPYGTLN